MTVLKLSIVVTVAATAIQEELVDAPVFNLLTEGENAQLLHNVKLARLVKVQDVREEAWIAVEVELPQVLVIVVTHLQDGLLGLAGEQAAQTRVGEFTQRAGEQAALEPPHVDVDQRISWIWRPARQVLLHHDALQWNTDISCVMTWDIMSTVTKNKSTEIFPLLLRDKDLYKMLVVSGDICFYLQANNEVKEINGPATNSAEAVCYYEPVIILYHFHGISSFHGINTG